MTVHKREGAAAPPPDASKEPIQTHDASERARPGPLLLRREGRDELLNPQLVFLELLHKLAPQFLWGGRGGEKPPPTYKQHDTQRPDQRTNRAVAQRERASVQCTSTTGSPSAGSQTVLRRRPPPPANWSEKHASSPERPPESSRTNRISTDDTASPSSAVT